MEKKCDVVAMGELLIDFTENSFSSQGNPIMGKKRICVGVVGAGAISDIYLKI